MPATKVRPEEHVSMSSYAKTFKFMQQNLMINSTECFRKIYENAYTIIAFTHKSYKYYLQTQIEPILWSVTF